MQYILITGANRGIGLEMVKLFLADTDAHIFAASRHPDQARDLQDLAGSHAEQLTMIQLDINDSAQIDSAVEQVKQKTDYLDILINNAGILLHDPEVKRLGHLTAEAISHIVTTNGIAPLIVSQAFIPLLKGGDNPRLVMITSQMGSMEWTKSGGSYAYRMSKAAMNMSGRTLAFDRGAEGITVAMIHPGWVQTDMGGSTADLTPLESAEGIVKVVKGLTPTDNGTFFRWDGSVHPW